MTCPLCLNNLLEQARAIRPNIRYVTAEVRYGDIGALRPYEFYAFDAKTCFSGKTLEELLADIRASLPEAVNA